MKQRSRKTKKKPRARIGTSGWNYPHWRGVFYPQDLSSSQWFGRYAEVFDTVEVNNTFYNLPEPSVFETWRDQAPGGFLYVLKASRWITHMKKLKEPERALERFFSRARILGPHLGPILYQLPPRWKANPGRLASFLDRLPGEIRHVFEFRDPSWFDPEILDLLDGKGAAFCVHDKAEAPSPRWVSGGFVYCRFHGPSGDYGGRYGRRRLTTWSHWLRDRMEEGLEAWAFFNNDEQGHALEDAGDLEDKLRKET